MAFTVTVGTFNTKVTNSRACRSPAGRQANGEAPGPERRQAARKHRADQIRKPVRSLCFNLREAVAVASASGGDILTVGA